MFRLCWLERVSSFFSLLYNTIQRVTRKDFDFVNLCLIYSLFKKEIPIEFLLQHFFVRCSPKQGWIQKFTWGWAQISYNNEIFLGKLNLYGCMFVTHTTIRWWNMQLHLMINRKECVYIKMMWKFRTWEIVSQIFLKKI